MAFCQAARLPRISKVEHAATDLLNQRLVLPAHLLRLARSGTCGTPTTRPPRTFLSTRSFASLRLFFGPASTFPSRGRRNPPAVMPAPAHPPCTCRYRENSQKTKTRKTPLPKPRAAKRNKRRTEAERQLPRAHP